MQGRAWSIPDELLERTDIDMYEKVLIAILDRLGALQKPVYPRHKWLAQKLGMSESGIRKILKRLRKKKIVKYEGRKWKIALYSLTVPMGQSSPSQWDTDSPSQWDTDSPSQWDIHKKDIQSKDIHINTLTTLKGENLPNEDINYLINLLKQQFQLNLLDGTFKENRRYCWLALKKFKGRENVELIIRTAVVDSFWRAKITNFKILYYNGVKIISSQRIPNAVKIR